MARLPRVTVIFQQEDFDKLEKLAAEQKRPKSNLVAFIVSEWLKTNCPE